jgi:hypothetical protein
MKFWGWLFMAIGVLVAGTAGLCGGVTLAVSGKDAIGMIPIVGIFAGIPVAAGIALFVLGLNTVRKKKDPPPHQ